MKKFYAFALAALLAPTVAMADATDAAYFDNYAAYQGTSSNSSRGCLTMTVSTSGGQKLTVTGTGLANHQIYKDYTEESKLIVKPGETISVTGTGDDKIWMHNYVYVDYGQDGKFDVDLNSTSLNGDLVAFTGYNLARKSDWSDTADPAVNSDGLSSVDGQGIHDDYWVTTPKFVLPDNLEPGEYRMRVKNDWNCTHPYGRTSETIFGYQKANYIYSNGGFIMDIALVVEGEVAADPVFFSISLGEEYESNKTSFTDEDFNFLFPGNSYDVAAGTKVHYKVTAKEGYVIDQFTINDNEVEGTAGAAVAEGDITIEENTALNVTFKAEAPTTATVTVTSGANVRRYVVYDTPAANKYLTLSEANATKSAEYNVGETIYVKVFANEYDGYVLSEVTLNGVAQPAAVGKEDYIFTFTLEGNTVIFAEGALPAPAADPVINYTIGEGGTVTIVDFRTGTMIPILFGATNTTGTAELTSESALGYSVTASEGYVIDQLVINGEVVEEAKGKTSYDKIETPFEVTGDVDFNVTFKLEVVVPTNPVLTYTVGEGGILRVMDLFGEPGELLNSGAELIQGTLLGYYIKADEGYVIDELLINNEPIDGVAGKAEHNGECWADSNVDINVTFISLESGVEAIEAAEEAAPVYYNLQGVRVNNPATGVYIRIAGDKAEKVYLRK